MIGYLEITTEGAVQAPAVIWRERAFHAASRADAYLLAPYYGALFGLAL